MSDPLKPISPANLAMSAAEYLRNRNIVRQVALRTAEPITKFPAMVMWPGELGVEWRITYEPGGQLWIGRFMGWLIVSRIGELRKELASTDPLVTEIIDAFAVPVGASMPTFPGLLEQPDRVLVNGVVLDQEYVVSGHAYTGAEMFFDCKFTRVPNE